MAEELLTVKQAAELLQVTVNTVKRYIYAGLLPAFKIPGGQHRIKREDIDGLLTPETPQQASADSLGRDELVLRVVERVVEEIDRKLRAEVSDACRRNAETLRKEIARLRDMCKRGSEQAA